VASPGLSQRVVETLRRPETCNLFGPQGWPAARFAAAEQIVDKRQHDNLLWCFYSRCASQVLC
jgi:hypothetical protein